MPYYDTGAPTPNTKNSITKSATNFGIRDFLLHRNIQNPIKYPYLSTSINGSPKGGEPFTDTMVGSGVVIQHVSIDIDGISRYNNIILNNQYKDSNPLAPVLTSINNINKIPIFPIASNGTNNYLQDDITKYGILAKSDYKQYRKNSTIKNLYLDASKQVDMADYVSLQPIQTSQQLPSYIDEYGHLNLGGNASVQAIDVIGSVLNGQGIGLSNGGLVTNFDIRSSLAGRVLTASGLLNDTKLGIIGGQQLALSLANNAMFNVEQNLFGKLNVSDNILSLIKNGNLAGFRPDYKITIPTSGLLDYSERILGFNVPKSYLPDDASLFISESGAISNIDRANSMIKSTGKGQVNALSQQFLVNLIGTSSFDNPNLTPFRSGYSPNYKKGRDGEFIVLGQKPSIYAFNSNPNDGIVYPFIKGGDVIPVISQDREKMVEGSGFNSYDNSSYSVNNGSPFATNFTWTSSAGTTNATSNVLDRFPTDDKKSLLSKTQKLFNSVGMKNIVATKGSSTVTSKTQIQTAISPNGFISHGSGLLSGSKFNNDGTFNLGGDNTAENTFCRSWTPFNRYDKVNNLIRHRGLNQNSEGANILDVDAWRQHTEGSVLDDNGFVKIAPYKTDNLTRSSTTPKKYMFSIENLAWAGTPAVNLLPSEQGPGDLLTGKFGRIMWFPPYDISFSENNSMNLETTNFIGRGEPIYTYNNTERTGQLSFKLIVDHPSVLNAFAGDSRVENEYIDSFFGGCVDINDYWKKKLTGLEQTEIEVKDSVPVVVENINNRPKLPNDFKIYFKNDRVDVDELYEANPNGSIGVPPYNSIILDYKKQPSGFCVKEKNSKTWSDDRSYGLNLNSVVKFGEFNDSWVALDFGTYLKDYLNSPDFNNYKIVIEVYGYASKQGCVEQNNILAKQRADNTKIWLENILKGLNNNVTIKAINGGESGKELSSNVKEWELTPKENRYSEIKFRYDINRTVSTTKPVVEKVQQTNRTFNTKIKNRLYTESDFFEKLTDDDPLVFDKIREKIKYFHPAFHSTTPEGFNSRLTFLLQCTRQGPTISGVEAKNLAFGPQPVCILRVGDFYNTKIMIDNISFDFEPLVWDLNPEGVGVQPMIANVSMSFKFIGGSTLESPINKLQNALSFNYFANTHVYDARADYVTVDSNVSTRQTIGTKNSIEPNYRLVTGLDLTKDSMSKISSSEIVVTQNINNTTNEVKTSQKNNTQVSKLSSTTPMIKGFEDVTVLQWPNERDRFSIILHLKTENVIGLSSNELTKFINKGIKITLEPVTNGNRLEEIIKENGNVSKRFIDAITIGTSIGFRLGSYTASDDNYYSLKPFLAGDYIISVIYGGKKIQSINIKLI
jgi:hypothetical protein